MAKKIYLVRHGQTNDNVTHTVQNAESVLSEKGERQAVVLAERLRHLSFQHLFVSDYVRTRQTVAPLLPYISVEPVYTPLARETKMPSQFIGVSNQSEEFQAFYRLASEHQNNPDWRYADEETFYDVVARVQKLFELATSQEGDVVIVTHGRFLTYMVMYVLTKGNLTFDIWSLCRHSFETSNTGITVLEYSEQWSDWRLLTYNDHAHFAE
jgi:probable phosphoglycerate mutase